MTKKDLWAVAVVGAAVGLLVQPMLSTLGATLSRLGLVVNSSTRAEIFFFFLILAPLALFIAYLLGKVLPVIYQFAKFAAVGTLNSFIYFGVINLLIHLTGVAKGLEEAAFVFLGFVLSTTNSYFWNKYWTFHSTDNASVSQAAAFYSIAAIGAFINTGASYAVVNHIAHPSVSDNLWANFGGLVGIGVSFLWNFLGYKYIVFRRHLPEA